MDMWIGLASPLLAGAAIGAAILIDRLLEPRRNPAATFAVVDGRTLRYAEGRYRRLVAAGGDKARWAYPLAIGASRWLRGEVQHGRRSKRVLRARQLELWEARQEELRPLMFPTP